MAAPNLAPNPSLPPHSQQQFANGHAQPNSNAIRERMQQLVQVRPLSHISFRPFIYPVSIVPFSPSSRLPRTPSAQTT